MNKEETDYIIDQYHAAHQNTLRIQKLIETRTTSSADLIIAKYVAYGEMIAMKNMMEKFHIKYVKL